jgi:hypothetical protein
MNERVKAALAALELVNQTEPHTVEPSVLSDGSRADQTIAVSRLIHAMEKRRTALIKLYDEVASQ